MRPVRPQDGIALENATPSILTGDIHPLTGAALGPNRGGTESKALGHQKRKPKSLSHRHGSPSGLLGAVQISRRQAADSGSLQGAADARLASGACQNCQYFSMAWIIFAARVRRPLQKLSHPFKRGPQGEMAEWLKAHAWKACVRETVPWVRIPLSPPYKMIYDADIT